MEKTKEYLGETPVVIAESEFKDYTPADWALYYIESYGFIDGSHHKQWVIDQVARILNGAEMTVKVAKWSDGHEEFRVNVADEPGEKYHAWVAKCTDGEDGPDTYYYDEGSAP